MPVDFRTLGEQDRRLAKAKRGTMTKIAIGGRFLEIASGTTVIYCTACSGPVVDSPGHKFRHAQKSLACRKAMGF